MFKQVGTYKFDLERIRKEVYSLLARYNLKDGQLCLTHANDIVGIDRYYHGTGSIFDFEKGEFRNSEHDFVNFNEDLRGSYLHDIYESLPQIGRFRIMVMDGPDCYFIHKDTTSRYHIAINTNEKCFFLFPEENKMIHVPNNGNVYLVDATKRHTFINGSKERRIHLVLDSLEDNHWK